MSSHYDNILAPSYFSCRRAVSHFLFNVRAGILCLWITISIAFNNTQGLQLEIGVNEAGTSVGGQWTVEERVIRERVST